MARQEQHPIEGLGNIFTQKESFMRIAGAFDDLQRRELPPDEAQAHVATVFGRIAESVPQAYIPIYWLARAYPDYIATAIPLIHQTARSREEQDDARKKIAKLMQIDEERKNPVEYAPAEDDIFSVSPQVERTMYNAIKYNDQGRPLVLLPMVDLPGIPGQVAVSLEQKGDRWGVALHLRSKEVDTSEAYAEAGSFREYTGLYSINSSSQSLALNNLCIQIWRDNLLRYRIGEIPFGLNSSWKHLQSQSVQEAFDTMTDTLPVVLGEAYAVLQYNANQMIVSSAEGEKYLVGITTFEEKEVYGGKDSLDGFTIERFGDSAMPRLTADYAQFQQDLQKELRFASGVLSWLYQYSRADIDYRINLQSPDFGLLDWMEGNSLIEKLSVSPNSFKDLGGNYDLRLAVEEDAHNFVRSYKGEPGSLKPQNTLLYGETGIGKTSLENGIAAELLEAEIPVFVLKGDLFAQTMVANPQDAVGNLKQMFYYLLMHGGAVLVRDFDALLGSRDNPEVNTLIEGVLLSELQRIKEDPSTWFVADTQFIGRISEALLNAHRIGKHREIPIEKDTQGIEHIITAVVRKVDCDIHRRTTALSFAQIQTTYPFDIPALAEKVSSFGGMIPAQIERMVREEMQANETEGYQLHTDSLLARVDAYAEERTRLQALREAQRADMLQQTATEALQLARDAMARVASLEQELSEWKTTTGGAVARIRRDVDRLMPGLDRVEDQLSTRIFDIAERLRDLEEQVQNPPGFLGRRKK